MMAKFVRSRTIASVHNELKIERTNSISNSHSLLAIRNTNWMNVIHSKHSTGKSGLKLECDCRMSCCQLRFMQMQLGATVNEHKGSNFPTTF